ncbi:MAG: DNA-directed DNA polymerase II small subunit, partial [Candidatus Thermoplasmatota archaeon]
HKHFIPDNPLANGMRSKILEQIIAHGNLIQEDAIEYILSQKDPMEFVNSFLKQKKDIPFIISLKDIGGGVGKTIEIEKPVLEAIESKAFSMSQKEEIKKPRGISIIKDITGKSTSEGEIRDFKIYFNDRFTKIKKILKGRVEMVGSVPISQAKSMQKCRFIGMVGDIKTTAKGYKVFEAEDENSSIQCFTGKENGTNLIRDEVIGIIGHKGQGRFYVDQVIRPGIPVSKERSTGKGDGSIVFISDIHLGSKTFLKESWEKFINWLKNSANEVNYLVISGDVVDGIGVYPGQESDLSIADIYAQYEELAKEISKIPRNIKIIMLPGNHDAVRPAEPQQTFPAEITKLFSQDILFVGNPCYFSIEGIDILAYHGKSMDDYITNIPHLTYQKPIECMKEMLLRRHLAPIYGDKTPIAPEHEDILVIDKVPDIFVTGHVHCCGLEIYRDIILINASTWQSQTSYQRMQNIVPEPAKAVIVDLKTLNSKVMDFR